MGLGSDFIPDIQGCTGNPLNGHGPGGANSPMHPPVSAPELDLYVSLNIFDIPALLDKFLDKIYIRTTVDIRYCHSAPGI